METKDLPKKCLVDLLPSSVFADPIGRRFPMHDKAHARSALASIIVVAEQTEFYNTKLKELHNAIVKKAKKFGLEHERCRLCENPTFIFR